MADGLLELVPGARVGHIGLYRDPVTKKPHEYLVKLPEVEGRTFILVDPMLATGNSAAHAVGVLNAAACRTATSGSSRSSARPKGCAPSIGSTPT